MDEGGDLVDGETGSPIRVALGGDVVRIIDNGRIVGRRDQWLWLWLRRDVGWVWRITALALLLFGFA
jgi:hypothetical protein